WSPRGDALYVATVTSEGEAAIAAYASDGAELWRADGISPVAGLAALESGEVVAASLGGTRGFGARGELLWRNDRRCEVRALGGEGWLCFSEGTRRAESSVVRLNARGEITRE